MNRLISSFCLFWGSIILGYLARRLRLLPPTFAPDVIRWLASWIAPPVVLLAMWVIELHHVALISLPFVGLAVSVASVLPAWWLMRRWQLSNGQRGSWLLAAFFSNVGYLGAIVAFAVWGEQAYGLCMLYFLFFGVLVYTVGYHIGDRYGTSTTAEARAAKPLELWRWTPMVGTVVGLALSWWRVPRPPVLTAVNHALIPLLTGVYLFTVGTTFHFSRVGRHWRPALWMSAIKLVYAPLVGGLLAWWLGYRHLLHGVVWRVTILESAMPTAITSLTLPALFGLDQDFANGLWIITTLCSMLVIPLLLGVL